MIKNILLVSIGGALGSVFRYLCQKWIHQLYPQPFPWGTFLVNITGCFLIGIFFAASVKKSCNYPGLAVVSYNRFMRWLYYIFRIRI
ncbi:MAG: CrcB family protein [Bacteroidota bacterium]